MQRGKTKKAYPGDGRTLAGFMMTPFTATMGAMAVSYYSMFLTDYSGIDSALGKTGFAAVFATIFILISRIVDAVDDPLQSWIMDSARERKSGKYRMFGFAGVTMVTVGIVMLFALPGAVKHNVTLLWFWVLVAYFITECGMAFAAVCIPIMQKATNDAGMRAKIVALMRIGSIIAALPFLFYVPIITAVGQKTGNLGRTAVLVTVLFTIVFSFVSYLGLMLLKEPYRKAVENVREGRIGGKELIQLAKIDTPLWAHRSALLIAGLCGAGGASIPFLKWKYCADVATGAVDLAKFTALSSVSSVLGMVASLLCPVILTSFLKFFKTPDRCLRSCYLMQACILLIIGVLDTLGLLFLPVLFVLTFLNAVPNGITAMMWGIVTMECADYAEYRTGRNTTALVTSMYNIFQKTASIIGTSLPNLVYIAVGYSVNEVTGAYAGNMALFPKLIFGLGLFVAWLPMVCYFTAWLIMKKCYKITPALRGEMDEALRAMHAREEDAESEGEQTSV